MSNLVAKQLKSLKHERAGGSPDAAWLSSTRDTLLMQIRNTVTADAPKTGWSAATAAFSFFSHELARLAAVPAAALALLLTVRGGAIATTTLAKNVLPGDALYGAKLAAERVNLVFASRVAKAQLELDIAGRRLDEMARIADGIDAKKNEKLDRVAALFTATMTQLRADLMTLRAEGDEEAIKVALLVDSRVDGYQKRFAQADLFDRSNLRLALLSLDQTSISALELIVDKSGLASNALPEAQLSSKVGRNIEAIASRAAAAPETPAVIKANAAVQEAKALLSAGDFKAAVLKVVEGANLVSQAASATTTPVTDSATNTPPSH